MRLAVIDCGTNTFNLLIIDVDEHGVHKKVYNTRIPVKLGERSINNGYISDAAFNRAVNAMGEFKQLINSFKAEKILAFATSAVRDASNGSILASVFSEKHGISIDIINGEREAELIYLGIRDSVFLNENLSLIMDIGGGSTEFILANKNGIYWKHSFNVGAARLLQRFQPGNPITSNEKNAIMLYLEQTLSPLVEQAKTCPPVELIGSSGAFESVIEMIHSELGGEELTHAKTEYRVSTDAYFHISHLIIGSTTAQRQAIKGLIPMRVDMIVISCLMIDFVLRKLGISNMRVSTYSLKEGAVIDFIQKQNSN